LEDPAICIFAAEEYGNEDRNWGARSKVRNCYFKKGYVSGKVQVRTEELQR
jgi:hypothetical protein